LDPTTLPPHGFVGPANASKLNHTPAGRAVQAKVSVPESVLTVRNGPLFRQTAYTMVKCPITTDGRLDRLTEDTMKTLNCIAILLLAAGGAACESAVAPNAEQSGVLTTAMSHAAPQTAATGTFDQTTITSLNISQAGPNTILEQTSAGAVSGTLSGSYTDDLSVVIHPNGRFNAHFTIRCECTMAGEQGVVEFMASDRGELIGPTLAAFAGQATITGGTGALSDLRGVLRIEGTIDLVSGLATYTYSGRIH
jgi:hypothetical protein